MAHYKELEAVDIDDPEFQEFVKKSDPSNNLRRSKSLPTIDKMLEVKDLKLYDLNNKLVFNWDQFKCENTSNNSVDLEKNFFPNHTCPAPDENIKVGSFLDFRKDLLERAVQKSPGRSFNPAEFDLPETPEAKFRREMYQLWEAIEARSERIPHVVEEIEIEVISSDESVELEYQ